MYEPPGQTSTVETKQKDVEILHVTDCHLSANPAADLLGVNTLDGLRAVLSQSQLDGLSPDLMLVTGDLAQDGSVDAYSALARETELYACPKYWFAGNHDHRANMRSVATSELAKVIYAADWQIIMLDSLVEGAVHGFLGDQELEVLEQALANPAINHSLVCLHHHPITIQSAWLDNIGLHNRERFWSIVDAAPSVRGVLWGHIHQDLEQERKGVKLMATPSTCIQFKPRSDDFAVDDIAPGYRRLTLKADGRIVSSVARANAFEFSVDMASNGY